MTLANNLSRIMMCIGLAAITHILSCDPVTAETMTIFDEDGKEINITYEIEIGEPKLIGMPLYATGIKQLAISDALLYMSYKWENGNIIFSNPITDFNGYTSYFSQIVRLGLSESQCLDLITDPGPRDPSLPYRQHAVLKHYIAITSTGTGQNRSFELQSMSEVSKGGAPMTVITFNARIKVQNQKLMMLLIDGVTKRLVEKLTEKMKVTKK